jgi:hypothetical protein
MLRSSVARWAVGLVLAVAVLGLLRFKPWQRGGAPHAREQLQVGFLPVT